MLDSQNIRRFHPEDNASIPRKRIHLKLHEYHVQEKPVSKEKEVQRILDQFMAGASPEELQELKKLMEERNRRIGGRINVHKMATAMADQIKRDIGLTQRNIKNTARKLVVDLALQYNPDISTRELKAVINQMVPEERPAHQKLPDEMLLVMLEHFVRYSEGSIPREVEQTLPRGWQRKYWDIFPSEIKQIIAAYLNKDTTHDDFWRSVRIFFKNRKIK